MHHTWGSQIPYMRRQYEYKYAHVIMICVATNDLDSYNNIGKWIDEIKSVTWQASIFLILTKSDLDGPVTLEMLKEVMKQDESILFCYKTSAKESQYDLNVHRAFKKTLARALKHHYKW